MEQHELQNGGDALRLAAMIKPYSSDRLEINLQLAMRDQNPEVV